MEYLVKDSLGHIVTSFATYSQAFEFKYSRGNNNWYITKTSYK